MLILDDLNDVTPGDYKWVKKYKLTNSPKHKVLSFSTVFKTIDMIKWGWWKMISVDKYKGNPKYLRCLSCQKEGSEDNKIYLIGVGRVRTDMIINLCGNCLKELRGKIEE